MGWSSYRPVGLTHYNRSQSYLGYTVITPIGGQSTYLLDIYGAVVHEWRFPDLRAGYGRILKNGNLLLIAQFKSTEAISQERSGDIDLTFEERVRSLGGFANVLREVDWESETVWEYANDFMHHDFLRKDDGNTMFPQWVELDRDFARTVRGGQRTRSRKAPPMLSDEIVEIDAGGNDVRRWKVHELLDPRRDPICPLDGRVEWTHVNSVDLSDDGRILFSSRSTHRVGVIDTDGKLAHKFGSPDFHHQHHASWLSNGNVQVFDNGMHSVGMTRSSIVEYDLEKGEVAWRFTAPQDQQFFSGHISGAERLPNGNVLICEGSAGRIFEATRSGEVVWEWQSPFYTERLSGGSGVYIFRAHRYALDHPAFAGRELSPMRHRKTNHMYGLLKRPGFRGGRV